MTRDRLYGRLQYDEVLKDWHLDVDPHVHIRAKRLFGQLKKEARGSLILHSTPQVCWDLAWFIDHYPVAMNPLHRQLLKAQAQSYVDRQARLNQLIDLDYEPPTYNLTKPLRSYQAREVALLLEAHGVLIGDDVGLGKTITAAGCMTDPRVLPAIVVCPPHIQRQWKDRLHEFVPGLRVHILRKKTPYELPRFFGHQPDVVITTYHKLVGWSSVLAKYGKMIVFDEIQALRHEQTDRFVAAWGIASAMEYRLGLSATPIYNYGSEIFGILNMLRPDCLGTAAEFKQEWCAGDLIDDAKAFGAFCKDNVLIVRNRRKDAHIKRELPHEPQSLLHVVESDHDVLKTVETEAAALAMTILSSDKLEKGVKWQASEQLSSLLRKYTGVAKAPYVAEFVKMLLESGEKVVLCGWHREVYRIWDQHLSAYQPVYYTGTETPNQKYEHAKQFENDPECRLMYLSLRSGEGLDGIQKSCSVMVFGELDYSPGVHEQLIGRLARDGQEAAVLAYYLVANAGSDPSIMEILGLKKEQKEGLMNPADDFIETLQMSGDRVRQLAAAYLKQIGRRTPLLAVRPMPNGEPDELDGPPPAAAPAPPHDATF